MLGAVVTQTGTPWRPRLLAIERPLRFPPMTNAPVFSFIERRPVNRRSLKASQLLCANRKDGIIRSRQRVIRRPELDRPQFSLRWSGAERVKRNECRLQTASTHQNSKRLA